MKVVLDTNVLVSGLLTPTGTCGRVVDLVVGGALEAFVDDRILVEYTDVLHRPELQIDPDDATQILALIGSGGRCVSAPPVSAELPDPDDLPFLEVAAGVGAVLVTGNTRHFPRELCGDTIVVSPAELIDLLRMTG